MLFFSLPTFLLQLQSHSFNPFAFKFLFFLFQQEFLSYLWLFSSSFIPPSFLNILSSFTLIVLFFLSFWVGSFFFLSLPEILTSFSSLIFIPSILSQLKPFSFSYTLKFFLPFPPWFLLLISFFIRSPFFLHFQNLSYPVLNSFLSIQTFIFFLFLHQILPSFSP